MKHYDVDAKKIIKNVVSLVVSAMLLIAATIAWFAQSGRVTVTEYTSYVKGVMEVTYSRLSIPSTDFLDTATGLVVKTRATNSTAPATSITGTALASYVTDNAGVWSDSGSGDWDLSNLYPGEFGVFRISYTSDNTARNLSITFDPSITSADTNALSAVSVYALAQSVTNGGTPQTIGTTTTTLADLVPSSGYTSSILSGINASIGVNIVVYYVVGVPATGGANAQQHSDAIQHTVASIANVDVTVPTSTPTN